MHNNEQTQAAPVANNAAVLPYPQMVENLFKNFDTAAGTLMHAAVGMGGEAIELFEGWINLRGKLIDNTVLGNIREELGDWRFYAQKVWNIYGWEWDSFVLPATNTNTNPQDCIEQFVVASGNVLDLCKKAWVYNKEVDTLKLYDYMVQGLTAYLRLCYYFGWNDNMLCELNREKLLTGKKARYASGTYSDEQAQARADKQDDTLHGSAELDADAAKLEAEAGPGAAGATLNDIK